jgi:hypothetical protein
MMLPSVASGLIISWCGMRGIVTLAAALALPDGHDGTPPFPYRDLLLFCAFCVVIGTLVIQGLTLRPLMLALGLQDDGEVDREVRQAHAAAAQAALQAIENEPDSDERTVVRREYETRLQNIGDHQTTEATDQPKASELVRLQRSAFSAERCVLTDLRARDEIGDDAFHRLEAELDWTEVHLGARGF